MDPLEGWMDAGKEVYNMLYDEAAVWGFLTEKNALANSKVLGQV